MLDALKGAKKMKDKNLFRQSVETHNLDQLMSTFTEDAIVNSPVSFKPFKGKLAIRQVLTIVLDVLKDFHYIDQLDSENNSRALIFSAQVGDRNIQGLDHLKFNDAGFVQELTVMVRPRSGVEALRNAVGPRLPIAQDDV